MRGKDARQKLVSGRSNRPFTFSPFLLFFNFSSFFLLSPITLTALPPEREENVLQAPVSQVDDSSSLSPECRQALQKWRESARGSHTDPDRTEDQLPGCPLTKGDLIDSFLDSEEKLGRSEERIRFLESEVKIATERGEAKLLQQDIEARARELNKEETLRERKGRLAREKRIRTARYNFLFPGAGDLYAGNPAGYLSAGGFVTLLGVDLLFYSQERAALRAYRKTSSLDLLSYGKARSEYKRAQQNLNAAISLTFLYWGSNSFLSLLDVEDDQALPNTTSLQMGLSPETVTIGLRFQF